MRTVRKNKRSALFLLIGALAVLNLTYAALNSNAKMSTVVITAKQMNVPITAKFNKVNTIIVYNPSKPEATKTNIAIDISSFDLGDPEYNKEVLKKEWFNATQFPKATFISTSMKSDINGKLKALGKLSIKGKTMEVNVPVTITKKDTSTIFDGSLPIKRLDFGVGEGDWADTSMVANEVVIQFHIVLQQ